MASQSARLISAAPIRSQAGCAAGPLCAHFSANFWETINRDPGWVASTAVGAEAKSSACRRENGYGSWRRRLGHLADHWRATARSSSEALAHSARGAGRQPASP